MALFKMKNETIAVSDSAMGNVHQTIFTTLVESVNRYAIGNTNTASLKSAVKNGMNAYLSACSIP